ncbi:3-oxoacyl-[acyl-carrier-protein] reductase [Wickerhamomyces ciferrii]|uniref:3-oxoacyl-[acyl-carrier-protein] reductase n=1 Tax=Wickerhamomyces ciferrii (strain ATCC 14091 / BCRC 22168 / CBS 111 / JCM 3599 / NBRC 0793 / NRRL Y-1031 F-60-10) TaxID=1206466 RepID=K0KQ38_WICCF|nr:3-oxoacyl-[acyl-carrier-protein] reductase [Wickerhamomyces ciferrii]CCH43549.1 3-oxoacyl-[acyl-carrier-protein] reductase [Wickerhamomyces ciferrii]
MSGFINNLKSILLPRIISYIISGIITLWLIIKYINTLYKTRGPWDKLNSNDLALITGGSNGLGLEISKILISKKVKVLNLDIEPPIEKIDSIYFNCDLSKENEIFEIINKIKNQYGIPTILINNAAIRHNELLIQLNYQKINEIIQINTMAPIILLKEFLKLHNPSKKLYIINMASILGLVSPSNLSIYSATKSFLVSLHDSLSHELISNKNIRFLLVTPGQLDTKLFKDVKPPREFFAPIIKSKVLANEIVNKIELGERGVIQGPFYTNFIPILRILPFFMNEFARWFSQMDTSVKQNIE